jgi:hypothetical protein
MSDLPPAVQGLHDHREHLRHEQEHLRWTADHMRALAILRRVEAHLYAHEAEIAAHRAEIARHEDALAHGAAHAPAPTEGEHAAAARQHELSGHNHARLMAAILALDDLL